MICEKLLDALNGLENSYRKLIELASLKKEAILISDYDGLVKITGLEQKCAGEIAAAEKERAIIVGRFLSEKKLPPDTGLTALIEGGHIAGESVAALAAVRDRLVALTRELKNMNDENNRLIASSKEVIEKSLEFVRNRIASSGPKASPMGTGAYSNVQGARKPVPPGPADASLLDFIV